MKTYCPISTLPFSTTASVCIPSLVRYFSPFLQTNTTCVAFLTKSLKLLADIVRLTLVQWFRADSELRDKRVGKYLAKPKLSNWTKVGRETGNWITNDQRGRSSSSAEKLYVYEVNKRHCEKVKRNVFLMSMNDNDEFPCLSILFHH